MLLCKFADSHHKHRSLRLPIRNSRRRSNLVGPFMVIILCTLFIYLWVTTYIWLNIVKNFESANGSRSLDRQNPFFRGVSKTSDQQQFNLKTLSVTFKQKMFSSNRPIIYPRIRILDKRDRHPNYNHLHFDSLEEEDFVRKIMYSDEEAYTDDIEEESTDDYYSDSIPIGDGDDPNDCQPLPWKTLQFPVCNTFHENNFDLTKNQYLGYGFVISIDQIGSTMYSNISLSFIFLDALVDTDITAMLGYFMIQLWAKLEMTTSKILY
jgi:hypothetical protein